MPLLFEDKRNANKSNFPHVIYSKEVDNDQAKSMFKVSMNKMRYMNESDNARYAKLMNLLHQSIMYTIQ